MKVDHCIWAGLLLVAAGLIAAGGFILADEQPEEPPAQQRGLSAEEMKENTRLHTLSGPSSNWMDSASRVDLYPKQYFVNGQFLFLTPADEDKARSLLEAEEYPGYARWKLLELQLQIDGLRHDLEAGPCNPRKNKASGGAR